VKSCKYLGIQLQTSRIAFAMHVKEKVIAGFKAMNYFEHLDSFSSELVTAHLDLEMVEVLTYGYWSFHVKSTQPTTSRTMISLNLGSYKNLLKINVCKLFTALLQLFQETLSFKNF
jgi:hypothetical protein